MGTIRLGALQVDPSRNIIANNAASWSIEPRIMDLLVLLAAHPGEVMSRDTLIEQVWKVEYGADESLTRAISQLRKTFREAGETAEIIETIPKRGYRLTVTPEPGSSPHSFPEAANEPGYSPLPATPPLASTEFVSESAPLAAHTGKRPARGRLFAIAGAAAAVILAAGVWAMVTLTEQRPVAPLGPVALAVLPFDNLSTSPDDQILARGIAREMRNSLSRMSGLRVLSDTSAFSVADRQLSPQEIGKALSATLLLDGEFERKSDTVELTAELVDAASGLNIWTGSEQGPADDLQRVKQLLLARIVEKVIPYTTDAAGPPEDRRGNAQAHMLVLKANQLFWEAQGGAFNGEQPLKLGDQAWDLVEQALAIDPELPDALVNKAWIMSKSGTTALATTPEPNLTRQMAAGELYRRALAIDPNNVLALTYVAETRRRFEWSWREAEPLFERAIKADPNSLDARSSYSFLLSTVGDCVKSLENSTIARVVDADSPMSMTAVARSLRCLGRHEEADSLLMDALAKQPENVFRIRELYIGLLQRREGRKLKEAALHIDKTLFHGSPPVVVAPVLTRMQMAADMLEGSRRDEFLTLVNADLSRLLEPDAPPRIDGRLTVDVLWTLAIELAMVGDRDAAVRALEGSIAGGSLYIPENMPYGEFEFTPEVRASQQYQRIWTRDPRLVELTRMRKENLEKGRMAGRWPDGSVTKPPL